MIDVKELRIGNLVLYKNKICMVNMVDIGDMVGVSIIDTDTVKEVFVTGILSDEIEPIPVTENILLKCGFTKEYHGFSCDIFELSYGRFLYDCEIDNDKLFLSVNSAEYSISGVSVQDLHQLQNIYYVLAWQELEVEL